MVTWLGIEEILNSRKGKIWTFGPQSKGKSAILGKKKSEKVSSIMAK